MLLVLFLEYFSPLSVCVEKAKDSVTLLSTLLDVLSTSFSFLSKLPLKYHFVSVRLNYQ